MPIEILMPALSPTMTEGNLAKWVKKEGDKIKSGDVIAEIETDKATMEVEAVDEGVMGKILVAEGAQGVKVNALIALLLEEGEDKKVLATYKPKAAAAPAQASGGGDQGSAKAETPATQPAAPAAASLGAAPTFTFNTGSSSPTPAPRNLTPGSKVFASPLAKRLAAEQGINIAQVRGTGPHGRVVRADVLDAKRTGGGRGGAVYRNPVEVTPVPNTMMRKVIAKRLTESKQWVPHFYLTVECELDALLETRKQLNGEAERLAGKEEKPAYKLSVNDFIIKAVALGMKSVPDANASWTDEAIMRYNNVDISVAVAIEGGLITPIVRNADQKTIVQISGEMKELAKKARDGKLKPEEFQGGGFSISNLGMYGIKNFAAIVNPPQGCILAVGAGEERVVVRKGKTAVRNMMDVTLSVDHRVVDGAVGAEFLAAFKRYIESPVLMLV